MDRRIIKVNRAIERKGVFMAKRRDWILSMADKLLILIGIWLAKLADAALQTAYLMVGSRSNVPRR
jgi:hypothetical protein